MRVEDILVFVALGAVTSSVNWVESESVDCDVILSKGLSFKI